MQNEIIWLIGASEGIGAKLAIALQREGATLILSARSRDKLEALNLKGAYILPLDVTKDLADLELPLIPTMVIYNAGYYEPRGALDFKVQEAIDMVDVNFVGALRVTHKALSVMTSGKFVFIGSLAGLRGLPNAIGYGASKAALIHFAENLSLDLKGKFQVQVMNPGFVKTRLTDKNNFNMPFIMSPDDAALRIIGGIKSNRFMTNFPKRFAFIFTVLGLLPHFIYKRLMK